MSTKPKTTARCAGICAAPKTQSATVGAAATQITALDEIGMLRDTVEALKSRIVDLSIRLSPISRNQPPGSDPKAEPLFDRNHITSAISEVRCLAVDAHNVLTMTNEALQLP